MNRGKMLGATLGVCLAASLAAWAAPKLLYPEFTPTAGTWEAPAGKLGETPAQPWSQSTVAAAVDGKPLKGKVVTKKVGEIIDMSCYLQVGKHGDKHRDCGQKCVRNGQPIGLLTKDGTTYILMEEEHNPRRDGMTDFRSAAVENMAKIMEITGTETNLNGQKAIYVTGFIKK